MIYRHDLQDVYQLGHNSVKIILPKHAGDIFYYVHLFYVRVYLNIQTQDKYVCLLSCLA